MFDSNAGSFDAKMELRKRPRMNEGPSVTAPHSHSRNTRSFIHPTVRGCRERRLDCVRACVQRQYIYPCARAHAAAISHTAGVDWALESMHRCFCALVDGRGFAPSPCSRFVTSHNELWRACVWNDSPSSRDVVSERPQCIWFFENVPKQVIYDVTTSQLSACMRCAEDWLTVETQSTQIYIIDYDSSTGWTCGKCFRRTSTVSATEFIAPHRPLESDDNSSLIDAVRVGCVVFTTNAESNPIKWRSQKGQMAGVWCIQSYI